MCGCVMSISIQIVDDLEGPGLIMKTRQIAGTFLVGGPDLLPVSPQDAKFPNLDSKSRPL